MSTETLHVSRRQLEKLAADIHKQLNDVLTHMLTVKTAVQQLRDEADLAYGTLMNEETSRILWRNSDSDMFSDDELTGILDKLYDTANSFVESYDRLVLNNPHLINWRMAVSKIQLDKGDDVTVIGMLDAVDVKPEKEVFAECHEQLSQFAELCNSFTNISGSAIDEINEDILPQLDEPAYDYAHSAQSILSNAFDETCRVSSSVRAMTELFKPLSTSMDKFITTHKQAMQELQEAHNK